jgi:hypothetical protein
LSLQKGEIGIELDNTLDNDNYKENKMDPIIDEIYTDHSKLEPPSYKENSLQSTITWKALSIPNF